MLRFRPQTHRCAWYRPKGLRRQNRTGTPCRAPWKLFPRHRVSQCQRQQCQFGNHFRLENATGWEQIFIVNVDDNVDSGKAKEGQVNALSTIKKGRRASKADIVRGAATITLDQKMTKRPARSDREALASDWAAVRGDLRKAWNEITHGK